MRPIEGHPGAVVNSRAASACRAARYPGDARGAV